jgi:hypothetical protein
MTHAIHHVKSFELVATYTLRIRFGDRTEQVIDFEPMLRGELYGPLRDPAMFRRVQLDPGSQTIVWPNGADFDPATLHDWPSFSPAMLDMARQWKEPAPR